MVFPGQIGILKGIFVLDGSHIAVVATAAATVTPQGKAKEVGIKKLYISVKVQKQWWLWVKETKEEKVKVKELHQCTSCFALIILTRDEDFVTLMYTHVYLGHFLK